MRQIDWPRARKRQGALTTKQQAKDAEHARPRTGREWIDSSDENGDFFRG